MAQIAVVGTGYVGLATGIGLGLLGHEVICVDIDESRLSQLSKGKSPISEPAIDRVLWELLKSGRVNFTSHHRTAVERAEFVFLCVPTPQSEDGSVMMDFLETAIADTKPWLGANTVLVNKSTVPVGTARYVSKLVDRENVQVVSNPEFLRQGSALEDFLNPSRIVVGGSDRSAVEKVAALYDAVQAPLIKTTSEAAELLKYAANSFLATKLTFINAIADICEVVNADVVDVIAGLGLDSRIGKEFLNPGPGWGGSCFPKDTRALVSIAAEHGYDFSLLRGVIATNDRHYDRIAQKVRDACGGSVAGKTVAALGLTFKAHTDDLRDSPAIAILDQLQNEGAVIRAHDPAARDVEKMCPWLTHYSTSNEAVQGCDVLVVLTEWPEYRELDPVKFSKHVSTRVIIDARNLLDREKWAEAGFRYVGVGR